MYRWRRSPHIHIRRCRSHGHINRHHSSDRYGVHQRFRYWNGDHNGYLLQPEASYTGSGSHGIYFGCGSDCGGRTYKYHYHRSRSFHHRRGRRMSQDFDHHHVLPADHNFGSTYHCNCHHLGSHRDRYRLLYCDILTCSNTTSALRFNNKLGVQPAFQTW